MTDTRDPIQELLVTAWRNQILDAATRVFSEKRTYQAEIHSYPKVQEAEPLVRAQIHVLLTGMLIYARMWGSVLLVIHAVSRGASHCFLTHEAKSW